MDTRDLEAGIAALRRALLDYLSGPDVVLAGAYAGHAGEQRRADPRLLTEAHRIDLLQQGTQTHEEADSFGDAAMATSSADDDAEAARLIALVDLARRGDKDAFGALYDHYHLSVFRFLYYRVASTTLAEDLASETFFRALRSMNSFRWQGKDFGAWLMTIARNLATDHFKAGRTRLEHTTEDTRTLDSATDGPEGEVLASLTNEALIDALADLPTEQRDCLVMRFLEGMSIAETADVLGRSAGAVKQLQLRGVRNLAKILPEGLNS